MHIPENMTVIGHVGRLSSVKNQTYLIDVFAKWLQKYPDSLLIIVGEGMTLKDCLSQVYRLGIQKQVIFTGKREDVYNLLLAMNLMVFPSIREGFPIALVEAQASKLPCLVSDSVTQDVKMNDNVDFVSLKADVDEWISKMEKLLAMDRNVVDNTKVLSEYGIKDVSRKLTKIYLDE